MVVGICRLGIILRDSSSLKEKRQLVRKILDRTRHKFAVAIAEVGDNDIWQRARLGFATVGNDRRFVQEVIDKVVSFVDGLMLAEIYDREVEVVQLGEQRQGLGMGKPTDWRSLGEIEDEAAGRSGRPGAAAKAKRPQRSVPSARTALLERLRAARQRGRDEAADAYARTLGSKVPDEDPAGLGAGPERRIRGGSAGGGKDENDGG